MPGVVRLATLTPALTRYAAAGGSCGAIAGLCSPLIGISPESAFAFGFLFPIGPLVWLCNSTRWVQRDLATWNRWEAEKRITHAEARELRRVTLRAMTRHRYGGDLTDAPAPPNPPPPGT